jgi:sugar phosphate permease
MTDSFPSLSDASNSKFIRTRFWGILLATWIGYAFYNVARRPFSVSRSEMEKEGLTKHSSSIVDSAFLIMYTVGQLMYGSTIKDRLPAKTILALGLLGSAFCAFGLVASQGNVIAASVIWGANGAFQAAGWASCMSLVTPWLAQNERGKIMGLWGTNMAAGGIAGNLLTSWGIGHFSSWQKAVTIDGILILIAALFLFFALVGHPNSEGFVAPKQRPLLEELDLSEQGFLNHPNARRTIDGEVLVERDALPMQIQIAPGSPAGDYAPNAPPSPQSVPGVPVSKGLSLKQTAMLPGVAALGASYFFHKLVRYSLIFWLPYYFTNELKYSAASSGFVASALDVGGVAGSIMSGFFADRVAGGTKRSLCCCILGVGMILSLAGFIVLKPILRSSFPVAAAAAFSVGFFTFGIDSLMTGSLLQDYADRLNVSEHIGPISGFIGGVGTAGSILQGYLTAVVSDASWDALLWVLTGLTAAAIALMWQPLALERQPLSKRRQHR